MQCSAAQVVFDIPNCDCHGLNLWSTFARGTPAVRLQWCASVLCRFLWLVFGFAKSSPNHALQRTRLLCFVCLPLVFRFAQHPVGRVAELWRWAAFPSASVWLGSDRVFLRSACDTPSSVRLI